MSFHYISFRYISFLCCNTFRYIKFLFWCFGLIISCYIIFFLLLLRQIPLHQFLLYQFPFLVTSDSDVTISVLLLYQFPLNQFPLYQSPLYQFPFFVTTDSVISISWKNVTSDSVISNSVISTSPSPISPYEENDFILVFVLIRSKLLRVGSCWWRKALVMGKKVTPSLRCDVWSTNVTTWRES